ncbi:hypothetical protein MMYC01_210230 [Madurella mycetomatis]|uniref:Uncharacterized protein n=1 Tax=Madurella mycetomatis TaxID=100816 RepID=A0A175VQC9_9PEZI|nr:hypothetical protein MMYC01_210230 [Madurella mycetomatis]
MATTSIPGSYPLDDSLPPTPDVVMQQPAQPGNTTEPQQPHRQRSKLHKPNDPRGHKHTDSGVGLTEPEPIQSSRRNESSRNARDEAVGDGSYSRDRIEPSYTTNSVSDRGGALPQNTEKDARARTSRDHEKTLSAAGGETLRNSTPYWGNLPKGGGGGIYNSVAGHGSAIDDHAEHHHLPKRGGVYNTVTGHGSQDAESRRHSQLRSGDYRGISNGSGPDNGLHPTLLPDITEERRRPSAPSDSRSAQPEVAPGFIPETAVRDDVMLAEAASSKKPEEASQRAFPLAASHPKRPEDMEESGSGAQYGALAGAAGLGAGAVASESQNKAVGTSPVAQDSQHSRTTAADKNQHIVDRATSRKHWNEKQPTPPVKKSRSHEDTSTKGEKKHKLFSIFHHHKDDSSKENRSTREHRRNSTGDHTKPIKQDAATNGAGTPSTPNRLRKQSKSEGTRERRKSPEPAKVNAEDRFGNGKKAVAGAAAGVGAFGLHHKHKDIEVTNNVQGMGNSDVRAGPAGETPSQVEVSTPFEHPREPPMPPLSGSDKRAPGGYDVLASGTPSGMNQASAARPVGKTTEPDVIAREPGDYTVHRSSAIPNLVRPSSTKRTGITAEESDAYNVSGSGVSSSFKNDILARALGTGEYGAAHGPAAGSKDSDSVEYNCLPSGTPSGVKVQGKESRSRHSTGGPVHDHDQDTRNQDSILASGTTSGIAPATHSTTARDFTARADDLKDLPIPSAAVASLSSSNGLGQQSADDNISSHGGRHVTPVAPNGTSTMPNRSQESAPDVRTYPHPETMHNMNPEVMPEAYTASAPRHVSPQTQQDRDDMVRNMSPEVMPIAYRTSVPRSQLTTNEQPPVLPPLSDLGQNDMPSGQKNRAANPALPAATASWGVPSVGQGLGGGAGKVTHKCQHCGRDNDISGYFT